LKETISIKYKNCKKKKHIHKQAVICTLFFLDKSLVFRTCQFCWKQD